jgi:hypothetical protein
MRGIAGVVRMCLLPAKRREEHTVGTGGAGNKVEGGGALLRTSGTGGRR